MLNSQSSLRNNRTLAAGVPPGLMLLFVVEMWERFSFYGMKALLILYLVNGQRWSVGRAAVLYGNYTALVYVTPLLGGYLADRFWGPRRCLVAGGVIIALGHFTLALESTFSFYLGLVLVVIGTGLFKPNVSTMVGELYAPDDSRRDAGFTIFFMGINVGSFLAPLVCGYLGQRIGWRYGFGAAGVGIVLGLLVYLWGRERYLSGIGYPSPLVLRQEKKSIPASPKDRQRILAVLLILVLTIPFWACYEQFGSSLSIFADRHVARSIGSFVVPASWFQSINPVVILTCGPLLVYLWNWLQKRKHEPSAPKKMVIAHILLAIGFGLITLGGFRSQTHTLVSPAWLIGTDVFRSWGELLLSPVGLSYVSRVAPARYASRLMAAWFLAEGVGNKLAGSLAAYSETVPAGLFYGMFVAIALISAIALSLSLPWIRRLVGDSNVSAV
jgi:POT family proton-dependent oligopeptide transporter